MALDPTDWFRIRGPEPFSDEAVQAFRISCAIYRAKMEVILQHWDELPVNRNTPKPDVSFLEPEISEDRRVLSLPLRMERKTLSSRALFQSTATTELHPYLPVAILLKGIEVGLTEPALQGTGWRHDWWDPNKDNSIPPEEVFRRLGFTMKASREHPGQARLIPGWRRRLQWLLKRRRS